MKPTIPIAVTTGSLHPQPTLDSIHHLKALGIHEIELTLQTSEISVTFERKLSMPILNELMALVQDDGLFVRSVHAPLISGERAYNLWARLQYLMHSIEICHLLGGRLVVIHPFHLFRTHEDALAYLSEDHTSLHAVLLPGINEAISLAQVTNVTLALENIQDWQDEIFFNSPENMSRFLRDLNHPAFGFTLDLMHAQFPGCLNEFIDSLATHIVNIHASDLLPPAKRVAIGEGVIDWQYLMPRLQTLPNLRQVTVELSRPQSDDITRSLNFLTTSLS